MTTFGYIAPMIQFREFFYKHHMIDAWMIALCYYQTYFSEA